MWESENIFSRLHPGSGKGNKLASQWDGRGEHSKNSKICMYRDLRKCGKCEKLIIFSSAKSKDDYEIMGEIWSKSQAGARS